MTSQLEDGPVKVLDEVESKDLLARNGAPVPAAKMVHSIEAAVATADAMVENDPSSVIEIDINPLKPSEMMKRCTD